MTHNFKRFVESQDAEKTYTANIPYPRMTVECKFDMEKIREQFDNMPTAQQLYDKCKDVKMLHMDSWLISFFGSKLIQPESPDPIDVSGVVVIDTLPDFINAASYVSQSELAPDLKNSLKSMRDAYLKLTTQALNLRNYGSRSNG
jgi:hypothetical protein